MQQSVIVCSCVTLHTLATRDYELIALINELWQPVFGYRKPLAPQVHKFMFNLEFGSFEMHQQFYVAHESARVLA